MPVLKLVVLLLRIEEHPSFFFFVFFLTSFARVSILLLGLKNKCRVFRVGSFFPLRRKAPRYMSLKMCRFRLSKRKTKGTWRGEGGTRRGSGCWCIHECIVPSFFTFENKLPAARAGRTVYIFLLFLSPPLFLSFSVSLVSDRVCIYGA